MSSITEEEAKASRLSTPSTDFLSSSDSSKASGETQTTERTERLSSKGPDVEVEEVSSFQDVYEHKEPKPQTDASFKGIPLTHSSYRRCSDMSAKKRENQDADNTLNLDAGNETRIIACNGLDDSSQMLTEADFLRGRDTLTDNKYNSFLNQLEDNNANQILPQEKTQTTTNGIYFNQQIRMERSSTISGKYLNPQLCQQLEQSKRRSFLRLKEWEEQREKHLNAQRMIIDHVAQYLINRVTISQMGMKKILRFFIERINQERAYFKTMSATMPRLSGLFSDSKRDDAGWTFPYALQACDQYHTTFITKVKEFMIFIQGNIVDGMLLPNQRIYETEVRDIIKQYKILSGKLNTQNSKTQKSTKEYAEEYQYFMSSGKSRDDLYKKEVNFLNHAYQQSELQKDLAHFMIRMLEEISYKEVQRYNTLKDAIKYYVLKMTEVYGVNAKPQEFLEQISYFDSEEEHQGVFNLSKMLNSQDYYSLQKAVQKTGQLGLKELKLYLMNWEFKAPEGEPLILFESAAKVEKNGQAIGSSHVTYYALTADRNIIVFDRDAKKYKSNIYRITKISNIVLNEIRQNYNVLEYIEQKKVLFTTQKRNMRVTFNTQESRDAFLDYFSEYCGSQVPPGGK